MHLKSLVRNPEYFIRLEPHFKYWITALTLLLVYHSGVLVLAQHKVVVIT